MPQYVQNDHRPEAKPAAPDAVQKKSRGLEGLDFAAQEAALAPPVQLKESPDAVQRKGDGGEAGVHEAAARGTQGAGQKLPHLDAIQRSFGGHDVSGAKAHVGGQAKEASQAMGAQAFATGDSVAFAEAPDLHTAAHEAAHLVQQKQGVQLAGGVGKAGDSYEQHADKVADAVVQGRSAEGLLGKAGGAATSGVQMDTTPSGAQTNAPAELAPAKVASAIAFNKAKGLKAEVWAQVAKVVGSTSSVVDATLVKAIAAWQAAQGLAADGKVGDITMGWLAQEPAGMGLENHVKSDNLLYVGMNPSSKDLEHNTLKNAGANVTAVKGEKKQGTAKVNGKDVDLGTSEGVKSFVGSLVGGIDAGRREQLARFLEDSDFMAKDELAQLARALNDAEAGRTIFTRVVLSGHSGGWSFWGDDNGEIPFDHLARIRTIFPKALGCVQDLCMSACNTGQGQKLAQYKAIFPNVKSIWAYVGYSPSAATGALRHVGNWEQATRGALNSDKIDAAREKVAKGSGDKDKNVATEVKKDDGSTDYKTASPYAAHDYETVKAMVDSGMPLYEKAMQQGVIDKQGLSTFYTNLQMLVGNFSYELDDPAKMDKILKQTLFLRYWENVTKKFMEAHGAKVKSSYGEAAMPAYAGASRDKVLAWIAAHPKSGAEGCLLLQDYLRDLNPERLPATWA